jgi:Tol biopolymer transport system component
MIWTVGANGQGLHALTTLDQTPFASEPVWSPDGSKIAFVSYLAASGSTGTAPTGIYVMNADGGGIHRLTPPNAGPQQDPAWSPDGKWLAFSQLDANWQTTDAAYIDRIGADGTGSRQLTTGGFWAGGPVISPDGTKIAFYRYKGTTVEPHTYLINSNGTGLQQLLTMQATPFSWAKL